MKKHIKIFSLIIILIIADQLTKLWALADLRGSEGIPVISGVFELQYLKIAAQPLEYFKTSRSYFY